MNKVTDPDLPPMRELMRFAHGGNECYEVARALTSEYPQLSYVEGRYHRALSDGSGRPDLPGHAWATTAAGTIIDPSFAQFDPLNGTRHAEPVKVISPSERYAYERYLPDESTRLVELLTIGGQK